MYAYCLMPDHLHLIAQLRPLERDQSPSKDLLTVLAEFKSFTTRAGWKNGLSGKLWQHDQYDTVLRNGRAFDITW